MLSTNKMNPFKNDHTYILTQQFPCPPKEDCNAILNSDNLSYAGIHSDGNVGIPFIEITADPQPEVCNTDPLIYPAYPPEVACSSTCCTPPGPDSAPVTDMLIECVDPCIYHNIYDTQCQKAHFTQDMCDIGELADLGSVLEAFNLTEQVNSLKSRLTEKSIDRKVD